ncbi:MULTISPECIES: hypothetical protein [Bradyrhizobium]|uniref:Uncharacterized protein n=2 Tax=Bradyrhizobium TaxID=374 RepID=A0ABY0PK15_9BRAD|nr:MULTISPECIES: hypothetical protein [Bradyrhizobium]SDI55393.1 hypothetical protein SAMN05444163_3108 [Bradyrhizobium ottawaense]SED42079.1 hypothetical protein SAMN05444171_4061 [Bradyrhizobium lablabi]
MANLDELRKLDADTLGDMLDNAERDFFAADEAGLTMVEGMAGICKRHREIGIAYFGVIRKPLLARVRMLERVISSKVITPHQWSAADDAHCEAVARLQLMYAAGREFYTTREHCDAEAREEYTEAITEIYWQRFCELRDTEKLIDSARREGQSIRRSLRSPTGYVKTGKHVRGADGVKIPVVRKQ